MSLINKALGAVSTVKQVSQWAENISSGSIFNWNGPKGGETAKGAAPTNAQFFQGADRDWRVKLSLPKGYESSQIMAPLKATGGFMFPFTPQIAIQHSANYQTMDPVHNNYPFLSYQNSRVDSMSITGDFFCEDATEAAYWVAAVHYLRSVTKMVFGEAGENAGAPPPVVKLNGYGDYVFKNVPVVVTQFSVDLSKDVDYIATGIGGAPKSPATASSPNNLLSKIPGIGEAQNALNNAKNMLPKSFKGGAASNSDGGAGQGVAWAPTKSTITVTVQPLYSRETVRQFSLDKFVKGEYVVKGTGYL